MAKYDKTTHNHLPKRRNRRLRTITLQPKRRSSQSHPTIRKRTKQNTRRTKHGANKVTNQANGSIPESWKWTTVEEIYDVVGGGTPSTDKPEYWNGDIPWITSADVIGLNNITPRKCVTASGVQNS